VQSDFDQIKAELTPGGNLKQLGVSALRLLSVHEFSRAQSWGHNPSVFFAVDSLYGGAEEFAQLVRAVHDSARALPLDVVYHHLNQLPLEPLALDVS
jgi:1,4-alpha-glucan branching enzyme